MPVSTGTTITAAFYNGLQTIVANILGPSGYNGTVTSAQVTTVGTVVPTATASQWNKLRADINACATIQVGSAFTNDVLPAVEVGRLIYASDMNLYEAAVNSIQSAFNNTTVLVSSAFSDTRTTAWTGTIDDEVAITWTSATEANAFFDNGGDLRLTLTQPTKPTGVDINWSSAFAAIGTIKFADDGTVITGTRGASMPVGWDNLTTSYQIIYNGYHAGSSETSYASSYTNDNVYVQAKKNATGTGLIFLTSITKGDTASTSASTTITFGLTRKQSDETPTFAISGGNNLNTITLAAPNTPYPGYVAPATDSTGTPTAAVPTVSFVAMTTGTVAASGTATNLTVATPTGVVSGDLMLAMVTSDLQTTITPPAGWALVSTNDDADFYTALYSKVAATEPASNVWKTTRTCLIQHAAWHSPTGDLALGNVFATAGTATGLIIDGVAKTSSSTELVMMGAYDTTSATTNTWVAPTGFTARGANKVTGVRACAGVFDSYTATTGSSGSVSSSWTGSANNSYGYLIAINTNGTTGTAKQRYTTAFTTASTSWTAPAGVTNIETAVGRGSSGSAGTSSTTTYTETVHTHYTVRYPGQGVNDYDSTTVNGPYQGAIPTGKTNYTETLDMSSSTTYSSGYKEHTFSQSTTPGTAATSGVATTAFGKTFAAGSGGTAAPLTTYNNIAVVPATVYPLSVKSSLSITYIK